MAYCGVDEVSACVQRIQRRHDGVQRSGKDPSQVDRATAGRNAEIAEALRAEFDLTPAGIIRQLTLLRPIYFDTAAYGHFGRTDIPLPWESVSAGIAR